MKLQKITGWKLFNVRPFVFGFAAMIAGIFFGFSFFVSYWFLVGFAIAAAAFFVAAIKWRGFFKTNMTISVIILLCFMIGLVSMCVREGLYRRNVAEEGVYYISAKVVATTKYDDYSYRTKIKSVSLFDSSDKRMVIKLDEAGYVWTKTDFEIGDKITFVGYYRPIEHNSILSISPSKAYEINTYTEAEVDGNSKTVFEKYKSLAWKSLSENMSESSAGVSFAMLYGDSSKVAKETKDSYRAAGIGHILAVSGLHVGFFVLLLSFLFNALHVNKKIKFVVMLVLLIIFSWLCGFSYSVLRASIMCVVLLYAELRGKQYDGLTALCFSSIIILGFVDPYQLFTVSFLLSFFAVLAIFCLYRWLDCCLNKIYPKKLASGLAVGISTSIGILPWQVLYFGYFPTFGILLNLLLIPLATVVFAFGFIVLPLCVAIPAFGVLLKVPNWILDVINGICDTINRVPFSIVKASIHPVSIVIWYFAVVVCSDFVFLPKRAKMWSRTAFAAISLILFGLNVGGVF